MKKNREFINLGEFEMTSPVMRVSDPCYERDVWCCGTVDHCKLGTWEAGVLKTDEGEWGTRCAVLAVRHMRSAQTGTERANSRRRSPKRWSW